MTTTADIIPTLDAYFSPIDGKASTGLPAEVAVSQQALHDHPFMWALDAFLFAGPDAKLATEAYQQNRLGNIPSLVFFAYKVVSTSNGVMQLARAL